MEKINLPTKTHTHQSVKQSFSFKSSSNHLHVLIFFSDMAHDNILRMNVLLLFTLILVGFCSSSLTMIAPQSNVDELGDQRHALPLHIRFIDIPVIDDNNDNDRPRDPWRNRLMKSLRMQPITQQQSISNEKRIASQAFHAMRG